MKVKPVFVVICVCLIVICIMSSLIYTHENREDKQVVSTTDTTEITKNNETKEIVEDIAEPTVEYPQETTKRTTDETTRVVETIEVAEETTEEVEEVGGETSNLVNLGKFKLTAYCSCSRCCGKWAGGATASGTMPKANRTIAVDTSIIPFGTEVIINGNTYVAEDTGGAIKGNRIDIYFDNHQDALNFGVQYAEVYKVVY